MVLDLKDWADYQTKDQLIALADGELATFS